MRAWVFAAALVLIPLCALAAPKVKGPTKGGRGTWYEWTIEIDASTDDSRAMAVTPTQCAFAVDYEGSGGIQVWQLNDPGASADSGLQLGSTISAQPDAPVEFFPGYSHIKVVATTTGADGSVVKVHCSNVQIPGSGGNNVSSTPAPPASGSGDWGAMEWGTDSWGG